MQRRLDLWSLSWLSRRSREAQNLPLWTSRLITVPIPAGNFEQALGRHFSVDFQAQYIVGKTFSWSKRACFVYVNSTTNGRTAAVRNLPTHRFRDWSKTEAALKYNSLTGYPKYEKNALHWRHRSFFFRLGKAKKYAKLLTYCLKTHKLYLQTIVTYDTLNSRQ